MEALQAYSWTGNIRELRNVIEHGVIVTTGDTLKVIPPGEAVPTVAASMTLADLQREHILETLERSNWRIKVPGGAAQKLGLKPSTRYTRMENSVFPRDVRKNSRPESVSWAPPGAGAGAKFGSQGVTEEHWGPIPGACLQRRPLLAVGFAWSCRKVRAARSLLV